MKSFLKNFLTNIKVILFGLCVMIVVKVYLDSELAIYISIFNTIKSLHYFELVYYDDFAAATEIFIKYRFIFNIYTLNNFSLNDAINITQYIVQNDIHHDCFSIKFSTAPDFDRSKPQW
jgi:hypothetical protein